MSWNGKPKGQSGKGDKDRSNKKKVSENMAKIEPTMKSCSSCKKLIGFDVFDRPKCKDGIKYKIEQGDCEGWER